MIGKVICVVDPKGRKKGCCGGGPRVERPAGFCQLYIKSREGYMDLLVPGDSPPRMTTNRYTSHDNVLFTNCRLYDQEGDETKCLACVFNPFRNEVVLFGEGAGRGGAASFSEAAAAEQLYRFIRGGVTVSKHSQVVDSGAGISFTSVGNGSAMMPAANPSRTREELENEFWACVLMLEALLYHSSSWQLSPAAVECLRVCVDSVARAAKLDAALKWACASGNMTLTQQVEAERQQEERVRLEAQRLEVERQQRQVELDKQQMDLIKQQRDLDAQKAALGLTPPTASPQLSPQASPAYPPQGLPQPIYQPQYQAQYPTGYPPVYPYGAPPPAYGPPPAYRPYGPPHCHDPHYDPHYDPHCHGGPHGGRGRHGRGSHSTGKNVAIGLGAGVIGALAAEALFN
ncbi:hypothetical protein GNI_003800 [Gregarina niphandrodes]|uniref:Uncharacterized protein n=1 Tax=Gregarina niphandrodes TaxID=110365 RepID=A0A023BDI0_GRENI|nr:hypothetical protein GNI_003800 [Gregarina niphandrodes]EZG88829.1 hypothetical protein GNI_003800 [Gregarina niphandrodes]|eukprot:XP_011128528.1 hypothetical protein GNI_003800 [Gregarina niphandrodes]